MKIEPFDYFRTITVGGVVYEITNCTKGRFDSYPLYDQKAVDELIAIVKKSGKDCDYWLSKYKMACEELESYQGELE